MQFNEYINEINMYTHTVDINVIFSVLMQARIKL